MAGTRARWSTLSHRILEIISLNLIGLGCPGRIERSLFILCEPMHSWGATEGLKHMILILTIRGSFLLGSITEFNSAPVDLLLTSTKLASGSSGGTFYSCPDSLFSPLTLKRLRFVMLSFRAGCCHFSTAPTFVSFGSQPGTAPAVIDC